MPDLTPEIVHVSYLRWIVLLLLSRDHQRAGGAKIQQGPASAR
jgi:hypothetical protein